MIRIIVASCLLCAISLGQRSFAISVALEMTSADYCMAAPGHVPTGVLEATVSGGTGPFSYTWYDVTFGMIEICTDCGPVLGTLEGLRTYKVIVTDALMATAEATPGVQGLAGPQIDGGSQTLAYEPGTSPVLVVGISNDFPDAMQNAVQVSMVPEPLYTYGPWPETYSLFKGVFPVGTTTAEITAFVEGPSGICSVQSTIPIDPPTILPDMQVVEVEGSCSNAGIGSALVQFSNGQISSELVLVVKTENAFQVSYHGQYHVAQLPYIQAITGLLPGNYWLVMTGDFLASQTLIPGFTYTCRDSVAFTIPSLGPSCGQVAGTVFLDNNLNCTKQSNEPGIPGTVLEVLPGPFYATTNSSGTYGLVLPNGSYTMREQSAVVNEHCTAAPIPFTISGGAAPLMVNHPTTSLVPLDVRISLGSGAARPGFEYAYGIHVRNTTVSNTGTVTVTMQLDPALGFLGATPTPTSISGGTLTWTLAAMPTYQERTITVRTQVPPDVALLGTDLASTASVSTALVDGNLANNTSTNIRAVTGSYDPNDKLAYTSSGSTTHYDPTQDQWIDYTIRFQNTGTDTAFHILITDTLPASLDPASFIVGSASHVFTWELQGESTLKFRLYNILLPDSNVNEPRSHGFVSFRIKPRLPLSPGAQIINRANIFFDFNPPVITDPCVLTVPTPPVLVSPRVFLGGSYSATTPPMTDALRVLNKLPRVEPYTTLGYDHTGTGGSETATPEAFLVVGDNAVVDWVLVELRQAGGAGAVVASRAALLHRDGDVVAVNGTSPVAFYVPNGGTYRVAVRHRNHLGVMTATPRTLTTSTTVVDLTTAATTTYGTNARAVVGGAMVLWPGDVSGDGSVKYTGTGNDRDLVLQGIGGTVPTNTVNNVYDTRDVNLNGSIMYAGTSNDRDVILQAIGGTVPTAVRTQQLP